MSTDTRRWEIHEDSDATTIVEADTLEEALGEARDWSAEGGYNERCMVTGWVREVDKGGEPLEDGEEGTYEVEAGPEPEAPECEDGHSHDWARPHEIVGGIESNPGVWQLGGTRYSFRDVCRHCGTYRVTVENGSQRNPGELETEVRYEDADERSLAYVAEQTEGTEVIRHGSFGPIVWDKRDGSTRVATQDDMDTLPVGNDLTAAEEDAIEEG